MLYLQQLPFQLVVYTNCWLRAFKVTLRMIGYGMIGLGVMFWCLEISAAQQEGSDRQGRKEDLEVRKLGLEIDKLRLEIANLRKDRVELSSWPSWLTGFAGFLTGILATATTVWVTRRTRLGALHQSVHDKRLESYPLLIKTSARLAAYFPSGYSSARISIGKEDCRRMGQAMSEWYFGGGGLLLSTKARDAYFRFVRALTRASLAEGDLKVPTFPRDAEDISVEKLAQYRKELKLQIRHVEAWRFGQPISEQEGVAQRFRDFVFLQWLSSTLRTKLSEDIRSRRRPS